MEEGRQERTRVFGSEDGGADDGHGESQQTVHTSTNHLSSVAQGIERGCMGLLARHYPRVT